MWNPDTYLEFADQRGRPYFDLLARVGARDPRRVVDLGCGPGNLTQSLVSRWPDAVIEAWDASPEMVQTARGRGLAAQVGDVATWMPAPDTDVVVSNAVLHWLPEHAELLVRWVGQVAEGTWIAFQVPGNFDAPSHRAVRELAAAPQWAEALAGWVPRSDAVRTAAGYAGLLTDAGCTVDAWETTYVHELTGQNPVLEWISGTALRPVRNMLDDPGWDRFRAELAPLLAAEYPARADGVTFFPFRRVFVVARVK